LPSAVVQRSIVDVRFLWCTLCSERIISGLSYTWMSVWGDETHTPPSSDCQFGFQVPLSATRPMGRPWRKVTAHLKGPRQNVSQGSTRMQHEAVLPPNHRILCLMAPMVSVGLGCDVNPLVSCLEGESLAVTALHVTAMEKPGLPWVWSPICCHQYQRKLRMTGSIN
jgi:hypothetical protein